MAAAAPAERGEGYYYKQTGGIYHENRHCKHVQGRRALLRTLCKTCGAAASPAEYLMKRGFDGHKRTDGDRFGSEVS